MIEPVATVEGYTNGSYHRNYRLKWHKDVPAGTVLYMQLPDGNTHPVNESPPSQKIRSSEGGEVE